METGLGIRQKEKREMSFFDHSSGKKMVKMDSLLFPPRKVLIKTFGCQMNYHDTERLLSHLEGLNFTQTQEISKADLVLFNTCAIRDLANNKFYSHLGELKKIKSKKGWPKIGIGGCVAQTEAKDLIKKYDQIDFVFGTDVIDTINDLVFRTYSGEAPFSFNPWDRSENFSIQTKITHNSPQAFVNIIKGCNKYCTYCIVPYTRGKERSRRVIEVVEDVRKLVEHQGIQEVTLLGQNVNSYGKENGESLGQLLLQLDQIKVLKLIRYTTSHPYDVSDELIAVHGNCKKLSNHLHLPVQSGSQSVLSRMNREYSPEHFLNLCQKLRKSNPNIVLSSDIIVAFPGETEEEFQMTLDLLKKAQFDSIFSYVFSARKNTKAADMEDLLSREAKKERLKILQAYQLNIQEKIRAKMKGKIFRVLIEGHGKMGGILRWRGRTNCNRVVHLAPPAGMSDNLLWHWVDAEIISTTALSCQGNLIKDHGSRSI